MNDLLISHVVLVDPAVIVNVHVFVLAVMVLLVARLVFGCVIVITGGVLKVYVYAFGYVVRLPAASHAPTVNVVVA